ncbi:phosphotransferase [Pasteurella sp. P03HT]
MEEINAIIKDKLGLAPTDIVDTVFLGGMTNKNYLVTTQQEQYVVRIPGAMTESLIVRDHEAINSVVMSEAGFNVETCFLDAESGIKITKYLSDSMTLDHDTIKDTTHLIQVAKQLRALHQSNAKLANRFDPFLEFDKYLGLLKDKLRFYHYHQRMPELLDFFQFVKNYLSEHTVTLVACHNDLVPENILLKKQDVYFIDWEYSGMNDPMFDLAAFFLEARLNDEQKKTFLLHYFQDEPISAVMLTKIKFYQFTQDVLWFVWTLVKEENNEFFDDYGQRRLERAISFMSEWKQA